MNTCNKFKNNKQINPLTGKNIKIDGFIYNLLVKSCEKPNICKEYSDNKNINPLTLKNIGENSKIKEFFETFCKKQMEKSKLIKGKEKQIYNGESCKIYPNFILKDHQIQSIEHMKTNDRLLLFHSVGSGKTSTSITIIRCLIEWGLAQKIYVITPTSLVGNYNKEMEKLGIDFGKKVEINTYGVFLNKYKTKTKSLKDSVFIIDEAHNFKTHIEEEEGVRSKSLLRLTMNAKKVILLSATPVQNNIGDFANIYAILKNKEYNLLEDPRKFYNYYERNWDSLDYTNIISIFTNLERGDYPQMNEHFVNFEMTNDYYRVYKKIEESEEDKFFGKNLKVFYNGIRRAINRVDENVPTPKIEWTVEKIKDNVKENKKTLVYSNWLKSGIRLVQTELDKNNILYKEISGNKTPKMRNEIVEKYNRGDIKVLFISAAGSEGLDLKDTRSIIIIEPHWNNERIKQIIGRGVRYKSHEGLPIEERIVDVYRLILKKPARVMKDKKEMLSADSYTLNISEKKEKEISKLYKRLLKFNILENKDTQKEKLDELKKILDGGGIKKIGEYMYDDKTIGVGSYGSVYMGWDKDNNVYVIKKMKKSMATQNEISNLMKIRRLNGDQCFDNILCYHDQIEQDDWVYLITKYVEDTVDMFDFIDTQYDSLTYNEKIIIIRNLAKTIGVIHNYNIAHSDIKPENILINPDNLNLQLIDFGGSCDGYNFNTCSMTGTIEFGSPEFLEKLLTKKDIETMEIYKKSDIFSLGIMFYMLMNNNKIPSDALKAEEDNIIAKIEELLKVYERGIKSDSGNERLDELIESMLNLDYTKRPDINEIIEILE